MFFSSREDYFSSHLQLELGRILLIQSGNEILSVWALTFTPGVSLQESQMKVKASAPAFPPDHEFPCLSLQLGESPRSST